MRWKSLEERRRSRTQATSSLPRRRTCLIELSKDFVLIELLEEIMTVIQRINGENRVKWRGRRRLKGAMKMEGMSVARRRVECFDIRNHNRLLGIHKITPQQRNQQFWIHTEHDFFLDASCGEDPSTNVPIYKKEEGKHAYWRNLLEYRSGRLQ